MQELWFYCKLIIGYLISLFYRREAIQVFMGGLRVAFCPLRRADASLSEAHGVQAFQVQLLRPLFLPLGPFGAAYEATPVTPTHLPLVHRLLFPFLHGRFFVWTIFLYEELFCAPGAGSATAPPPLSFFLYAGLNCERETDNCDVERLFLNRCFFPLR